MTNIRILLEHYDAVLSNAVEFVHNTIQGMDEIVTDRYKEQPVEVYLRLKRAKDRLGDARFEIASARRYIQETIKEDLP